MSKEVRLIAMYLPQFHPIPENDLWWGKGFTEWTNVAKAKPLFKNHDQPQLPADLGFYDLRLPEARQAQADLAREYGLYGFCYYHYWFNGRRLLETPFNQVLSSGKPDFPFMLCWANHNWTRVWDDQEKHLLLKQTYSEEDDVNHIRSLIPAFRDERYIKIDGKPVFSIYRSTLLPNPEKTIHIWREEAYRAGIELYLCRFEGFDGAGSQLLRPGFDAAIEFQPAEILVRMRAAQPTLKNGFSTDRLKSSLEYRAKKILNKLPKGTIIKYKDLIEKDMVLIKELDYKLYPSVTPKWDNSPRRTSGYLILEDSTPDLYKSWLEYEIQEFNPYSKDENFIFVNAMNEWGEGNYLEPCQRWGRAYLEATRDALFP